MQTFHLIWGWAVLLLFAGGAIYTICQLWRVWRIPSITLGRTRVLFRLRRENLILRLWLLLMLVGWRIERLLEL